MALAQHCGETLSVPEDDAFPQDVQESMVATRLHVLDGLISAHGQWEVITRMVWSCRTPEESLARMMAKPFRFSEVQAQHILDVSLRRQTYEQLASLKAERQQLAKGL